MHKRKKHERSLVKLKAGVVIQYRGRVLLIRERHNPTHPYRWNIVKGTFEPGKDLSIMHTAIREAREEAHAKIKLRHLLGIYYLLDGHTSITMFTFIADLLKSSSKISEKRSRLSQKNGEDIIEAKLFTKKELTVLKPKDFVGLRGYLAIQDYLHGKRFPLGCLTTLPLKNK